MWKKERDALYYSSKNLGVKSRTPHSSLLWPECIMLSVPCPKHPKKPVKLEHLLPDIFLSDLGTSELIENYKSIEFKESIGKLYIFC